MSNEITNRVVEKLNDYVERKLSRESTDTLVEAFMVLICTQAISSNVSLDQLQRFVAEVYMTLSRRVAGAKVASLKLVRDEEPLGDEPA